MEEPAGSWTDFPASCSRLTSWRRATVQQVPMEVAPPVRPVRSAILRAVALRLVNAQRSQLSKGKRPPLVACANRIGVMAFVSVEQLNHSLGLWQFLSLR